MLIHALLQLAIGYFVCFHVCRIVGAKGTLATCIKLVGVLLLICGVVNIVRSLTTFE